MAGKSKEPASGPEEEKKPGSTSRRGGRGSSPPSSASGSPPTDPLAPERDNFTPPADGSPVVEPADDFEPAPPELLEWTPERAGALVRGFGFVLHSADGLAHEPGGEELWRATMADADAIGPPLARILNRYAPARRLAGVSDEAELAFAVTPYVKRNLQLRGRLHRERVERAAWLAGEGEPPATEQPAE